MRAHECYHCKQWVEADEPHDCWTTTETALTRELSEDLQEAWERLRETAAAFGEQRIYASHKSIMFARKSCYFFVRPKKSHLEVCIFLGRAVKAPQIRRVDQSSKSKRVNFLHIKHRDEVEAPITDWLREAYDFAEAPPARVPARPAGRVAASKAKARKRGATPKRATPARKPAAAARRKTAAAPARKRR